MAITIAYGSEYEFLSDKAESTGVAALDATHIVVIYRDLNGDNNGHAKVGVISSGDEIAYGSSSAIGVTTPAYMAVTALDATHFVVAYNDWITAGRARIGVVSSGNVITFGDEYTFNAGETNFIQVAALDATHFVVAYRDAANNLWGTAIIGVVSSGDNIAFGSEYWYSGENTKYISVAALDSTHFVVGYARSTFSGRAIIGVVSSGDVIAYGSEYTFNSVETWWIAVDALDSTHFAIAYRDRGGDGNGHAKIGVVSSGDVIAYGSEYTFNAAGTSYTSVAALDSTHFAIGYADDGDSFHAKAIIGTVSSGDNIAYDSVYEFNAAMTLEVEIAVLDTAHLAVAFYDYGGDKYGIARIGVVSGIVVAPTVTTQAVLSIGITTATGNGNITDTGSEDCDKRGIVYDLASQGDPGDTAPAVSDYAWYEEETDSFGTGAFTRSLTGLTHSTEYFTRAYAHNSAGYAYGDEVSFFTATIVPRRLRTNIDVKLYDKNLSSPSLVDNLTKKYERLRFSTKLHGGFHIASFRLKATIPEAWEWLTHRMFYRLVISDGKKTLWEGRVEDIDFSVGETRITAYGYYANLSDVPYSTAYNADADVVIKAVLTASCAQISSTQTNIDATGGPAITSAAAAGYLDIYPQQIVEKLLNFSDDTNSARWYFAIWEDRIPYIKARSVTSVDWRVGLRDFNTFLLAYRGGDIWNACYALYDPAGVVRTVDANDTDSQTKYGLTRKYVIPQLGTVVAGAATSARDGWLADHKDAWPRRTNMVLGDKVYNATGIAYPSYWVRAGEVLRVRDLVPTSVDAGAVTRDALRTYYIIETEYDVDRAELTIIPDTQSITLDSLLATTI